jgi:regulator of replication initiation timing
MQPDLLSMEHEEEQLETLSARNLTTSEPPSLPDLTPLASSPDAEATALKPVVSAQKKRLNLAVIGLGVLLFLLLLAAFGWVGYWAYTLSTELTTTQQQLSALQASHHKLQTDYTTLTSENEKLNADLNQSKTDLEKASTDLSTAQAELDTSRDQNESLNAKLEQAGDMAEILFVLATSDDESDILKIDRLVTDSNNKELMKQWDTFAMSPSKDALSAFLNYLILATRNSLR